ncbi:MAG: MmgE/PrpD family protein [Boseongicola sp.]|nr:MmgE/PrpD family protein [Boseongicola sp.]
MPDEEISIDEASHASAHVGATRAISRFVTETAYESLPAESVELAKRCILDGTGVMIAGSTEPCARIARNYVRAVGGVPKARTVGAESISAPAHLAALANGVAGHALDYDDSALSTEGDRSVLIHPTMQPLCACLALAEQCQASGADFLTAFILGFDVQVKIAEAIHPDHFAGGRGFHSSGTIGVFGSVIAAGKVMGLTEIQVCNSIAIAATMAAGLGVNHGTMSKPLNMGRAAESGITAARLASLGFDGPADALEGGRGFFEAFGGGFDSARLVPRLGSPFAIIDPGPSIKPYPCGVVGHAGMDAMQKLVSEHDIEPGVVESIHVKTGANVIAPGPLRVAHATDALEAKFCVPFQMAAMVLRRKAGLAEFSDDFVTSSAVQAMQRRVSTEVSPEIVALGKDRVVFDISLVTKDGRTFQQSSASSYRGGPANPMTWDEICGKFRDCAGSTVPAQNQNDLATHLAELESVECAARVFGLVSDR